MQTLSISDPTKENKFDEGKGIHNHKVHKHIDYRNASEIFGFEEVKF